MENIFTPMKPWYSANSFIRRDFYKCHFSFPILFHKWAQTLFMILAVMDARINHVHPCVFFATFQTAQRPGLLKYNSWGTGDKCECESSTSSNQVHLKNLNASGFHSYLLDKESISAWWSESQTKVREDFFFILFAGSSSAQKCSKQLPSHCLPIRERSWVLLPGWPWGDAWNTWARGAPWCHIWPTFEPSQAAEWNPQFAKYSQHLQYAANPKICLEKKERKQKKMKKKIMLIVQKAKSCFSVPQRRCGPVGEGCTSSSAQGCRV